MKNEDNRKSPWNNIVLCGPPLSGNMGGPALVSGGLSALRYFMPDAEYSLVSLQPEKDRPVSEKYGLNIAGTKLWQMPLSFIRCLLWAVFNKLGIDIKRIIDNDPMLRAYRGSDLIINMTGISFHDSFGKLVILKHVLWLLPAFLLKKKVVIYSQTLGPFVSRFNKFMAFFCLNRVELLIVRGRLSRDSLKKLGINRPIYVKPDVGFLLVPVSEKKAVQLLGNSNAKDNSLLVGVTVNRAFELVFKKRSADYLKNMARLFDHICQNHSARLVFIPHTEEDKIIAEKISTLMESKDKKNILAEDYSAEELKGIIGLCDVFIGSRFHSIVASLSLSVPTLAVGWNHKYSELMSLFGQDQYLFDFNSEFRYECLKLKIDKLIKNREEIKAELRDKAESVRQSALSSALLIKNIKNIQYD